jgi:hypothetical protein
MVSHIRTSVAVRWSAFAVAACALAAACTVAPVAPQPGEPWDAGSGDGGGGSGGSSSSGGSGGSSGSTSSSSGGGGVGDAGACAPASLATYQPTYHPASGPWLGACSTSDIHAFDDACLGTTASTDSCNAFRQANADCVACILSPESDKKYGPLVDHVTFVTANVAGCFELEDPTALACAKAVQALDGCELAACETNCAVHDATSLASYETCASEAETGGCGAYSTAAACGLTVPDAAPAAAVCLADFQTFYDAVVPFFCGPPPGADGGPHGPVDGSAD